MFLAEFYWVYWWSGMEPPLGCKAGIFGAIRKTCFSLYYRQHFIAKSRVVSLPSSATASSLKSAELGLIDCHEYDKFENSFHMG